MSERSTAQARRAGVVGSPIAHSLSPVLHTAAYRELGLLGWSYDRHEVTEQELPGFVAALGPEWTGLSVTMPGKHAALRLADVRTERAAAVGAANTLVRRADGWLADCTDVDGVVGALGAVPGAERGLVLGAGGTAAAALAAFAELGMSESVLAVREPARARSAVATAERLGLRVRVERLDTAALSELAGASDVVVSALPAGAWDGLAAEHSAVAPHVLDVLYAPWPTPLARAVSAAGGRLATGLDMLLHQAFGQVEWFTGLPAPRAAMRAALAEATGGQALAEL
ncbi:shikimate dehydrogenase [Bounagaea algeriensis]